MLLKCVALAMALAAVGRVTQRAQSDEIVEAALATGHAGEKVTPYRLRREVGYPRKQQVAIYTKFVRVALAAWTAKSSGKHITQTSLPKWVTDDSVYVVFASPCPDGVPPCDLPWGRLGRGVAPTRVRIGPLILDDLQRYLPREAANSANSFVNADGVTTNLQFLDAIGGLPFDDAFVVATFNPQDFVPGLGVYALWQFDGIRAVVGGTVTDVELRAWR
jgi:hypothetical protein